MKKSPLHLVLGLACGAALLGGCERLGIPDPARTEAHQDAEGQAVGSACRHAGRAIEDCFTLNPSSPKAAVFAGWKEMNDYMVENKITEVAPQLPPPPSPEAVRAAAKAKRAAEKAEAAASEAAAQAAENTSEEAAPETPRKRRRAAE